MSTKTCPKCRKKIEDEFECKHCGINFEEYEFTKQEKLREVRILLGESKFKEAKVLAETLPAQFPDNQRDFLLILSNINRDISIVEKCELARQEIEKGNFSQATFLLRNIKAFDHTLNEKVISLRRKAERHIQNDIHFSSGIAEFNMGNYAKAKQLLKNIEGHKDQEEIDAHLQKIELFQKEMLNKAVDLIKKNQLNRAVDELNTLVAQFPDMKDEVEAYTELLSKQEKIKEDIFKAARRAKDDKRFLEAKILYLYLSMQYPETQSTIQPYINDIGQQAIVSLAEVEDDGRVDRAALGLNIQPLGVAGSHHEREMSTPVDLDLDQVMDMNPVIPNAEGESDLCCAQVNVSGESVPDFIY